MDRDIHQARHDDAVEFPKRLGRSRAEGPDGADGGKVTVADLQTGVGEQTQLVWAMGAMSAAR